MDARPVTDEEHQTAARLLARCNELTVEAGTVPDAAQLRHVLDEFVPHQ